MAIARDFSPRLERDGSACGPSASDSLAPPRAQRASGNAWGWGPKRVEESGAPRASSNDIVLDVAGLGRLLGDARAIGSELVRAGGPRVAVAPSQIAARLLARAHPGLTVVETAVPRALADVPLGILRQLVADDHGIVDDRMPSTGARQRSWPGWPSCEQAFDVLRRWGLTALGEFATLPASDLAARLGQDGLMLQRAARGIDRAPLVPDPDVPRFVQSMELEWPIDALEPLSFVFARLLDPLACALERADRAAAAVRLDLRLVDRSTHTRMLQLPAAMRDPRVLRTLLLLDLESHPPSAAVDIVSIEVDPAPSRIVQYSLLERALPLAETLATLNARLAALVGDSRCGSPVLLDTHRPDGFRMRRFTSDAASRDRTPGGALPSSRTPGPPIRRFRPAVAVRVSVDRGRPVRVAIDRQGMPGGGIERAAGPWRTSGAWWTAERWNRDEWDVGFDDGTLCRLFRDRDSGTWFLDGVID
jgi:protein ImuB